MTPVTTVSNITHDARLNGQRLIAPVVTSEYPMNRPDNESPVIATGSGMPGASGLLSTKAVSELKQQNTQQLLKSNYWFEMANIARWCTTALIALSAGAIVTVAKLGGGAAASMSLSGVMGAIGTAVIVSPLVWTALGALAIAATTTVLISQHSRRVFVEKNFDVQDTLMQRQAQLMGKSVEEAVMPHSKAANEKNWVARMSASLDQAPETSR